MKNSTMIKHETGSNRCETSKAGIKNRLKIIATSALLLVATNATAGITSLHGSNTYTAPELALMTLSQCPGDFNVAGCVRIHATGLTGELTIQGRDFPPEHDIATTEKVVLPFDQELELIISPSLGFVEGRASGQIHINNENMFVIEGNNDDSDEIIRVHADVQGNVSCLPLNGLECGQLVVDLELQGVVSDPNDPAIVGRLQMHVLTSFYFDGSDVGLASMSANTTIGGNEGFINSIRAEMLNNKYPSN